MNKTNFYRTILSGFISFFLLNSINSSVFADNSKKCTAVDKAKLESILKKMNVPSPEILSITQSPLDDMCEVGIKREGTINVFYVGSSLDYLMLGPLIETKSMINLTAKSLQNLQDKKRIDLTKIYLNEALVVGDKSAEKKIIVFTDPD
jgi:hypothetical protein